MAPALPNLMEAYLAPTFSGVEIANGLVRKTTTVNDATVDLGPAARRVEYDIEAVEKEISQVVASHPGELVAHAEAMEDVGQLTARVTPALRNVSNSYAKLIKDFVVPYEQARDAHRAASKLEQTAALARALAWYLHLAKQIDAGQQERAPLDAVVQAAKCYPQIRQLVAETPSLSGLAVVRQHEPALKAGRTQIEAKASTALREGMDKTKLVGALVALQALDVDVRAAVDTLAKSLVGTTVLQLSRSSSTGADTFSDAVADTKRRAKTLGLIDGILLDMGVTEIKNDSAAVNLVDIFWEQVAKNMDLKLKTMTVANQSAIRAMSNNRVKLFKSIESVPPLRAVYEKYITA